VPAAAVIPASAAYINIAAVKKLVVCGYDMGHLRCFAFILVYRKIRSQSIKWVPFFCAFIINRFAVKESLNYVVSFFLEKDTKKNIFDGPCRCHFFEINQCGTEFS